MSKITIKNSSGVKEYLDVLTQKEIDEANRFLERLQSDIENFEVILENDFVPNTLQYKYEIGKFLFNKLEEEKISDKERPYVWDEIKNWVSTDIKTTKDRSSQRQFYEYCYRLYEYEKDIVFSFNWRQWSEFLDRSVTLKDKRILYWLKDKINELNGDEFRLYLQILTEYTKKYDTTIFTQDELHQKYDLLLSIVHEWTRLMRMYFNNSKTQLTKARREKFGKYKKKYVENVIKQLKFKNKEDVVNLCTNEFTKLFVEVSNN